MDGPSSWSRDDVARKIAARPRVTLSGPRPASVLVALMQRDDGVAVLLTRRPATMRNHAGQYAFPGGLRDADDADEVATALREAHEEVGIAPHDVDVLGVLDDRDTTTGYVMTPVVGWIRHPYAYAPNPREVEYVTELPLRAFFAPRRARTLQLPTHRRCALGWDIDGHFVWGATAWVLYDLTVRLGAGSPSRPR